MNRLESIYSKECSLGRSNCFPRFSVCWKRDIRAWLASIEDALERGDGDDGGYSLDTLHHPFKVILVCDLHGEAPDQSILFSIVEASFDQVALELADSTFDLSEKILRDATDHTESPCKLRNCSLPLDFDAPLLDLGHVLEVVAVLPVYDDPAATRNIADNGVSPPGIAAFCQRDHQILLIANLECHSAWIEHRSDYLVLGYLRRLLLLDRRWRLDLFLGYDILVDYETVIVLVQPRSDFLSCIRRLCKSEPVDVRMCIRAGENLNDLGVLQWLAEWNDRTIGLRSGSVIADLSMNVVGEVECSGIRW